MPELPEVETVVRELANSLPGCQIRDLEVIHADLLHEAPESFRRGLLGATIESVSRRGKNILLALSHPSLLVVNLGMTGQLLLSSSLPDSGPRSGPDSEPRPGPDSEPRSGRGEPPHLAINFLLAPEGALYYADTRRFGSLRRYTEAEWRKESARLGPEPFEKALTPKTLRKSMDLSRSPIRSWLLDQTKIAGIGNIYACEALFRAGIHPSRPARSLAQKEATRLLQGIRDVLSEAIRGKGTTLRDYRTSSGDRGGFGPSLLAYGREGSPCVTCNATIERIVFANRSAFFCPICQS